MLSGDSGAGNSIPTPCSVSKRLFGPSGSSSKRSLFGDSARTPQDTETSGDESDLGPMSPLALTDQGESSSDGSPRRRFSSLFRTPEKSPRNVELKTWDRLRPSSAKNKSSSSNSPFGALKISTRAARSSPKRRIHENSPTSLSRTPRRQFKTVIGTPERAIASLFNDDIVPETPQKDSNDGDDVDRVEETPRKDKEPERTLITPSGSVVNRIVVPKLHRRKSLCPFDNEETSSPERKENVLKRHANDNAIGSASKLTKTDDNASIPKARASLFRENNETTPQSMTEFTVSVKSFYKSSGMKRGRSMGPDFRESEELPKKRHSLPSTMSNHTYNRRPSKRQKHGEMNAGVRHGIKRPKPKRHVSRVEAFKNQNKTVSPKFANSSPKTIDIEIKKESEDLHDKWPTTIEFGKMEKPPAPIVDPRKRFFKTNRTMQSHQVATVTVNNKIKLNVSDGKIALSQKRSRVMQNSRKKDKLSDISFDTTDLTVDEPGFDTSITRTNVDGILKVLEDDWADDDYDTMETLTAVSPKRRQAVASVGNVTMSPGSVLSDMTSSMNIEDLGGCRLINGEVMDVQGCTETSETHGVPAGSGDKKLFPLFAKGFSSRIAEETMEKKSPRGIKRSWQTSLKGGCGGAEDQYQIDAGQKKFGATTCNECGIVYQLGDPEDENAHLNYHNSYRTLRFNGWKKERVIMTDPFTNSRIIAIEPGDPKSCWKKVGEVLTVVDRDLGLAEMEISSYLDKKTYFYVRDKTILGVAIVECTKIAHRMIPELLDLDCCSNEETPVKCGVNVIWTAMSHRRQHIATKLLDTVRATYYFGYIMSIDDIAFSMPTPSGKIFAEKYTKTRSFKVYT